MSEVRRVLERVHRQFTPPGDAFERLLTYRARRRHRQRLTAVLLALIVAAAGTGLAVRAFQQNATPAPAETPTPEPTLAPASPRVVWTVPVGPKGQTSAILYAEDGLWVSFYQATADPHVQDSFLARLDSGTGKEVARIEAPVPTWEFGGGGLAAGFGSIWVTGTDPASPNQARTLVDRVDPATNRVIARIPLEGQGGADIAIGPDAVWVAFFGKQHAGVARIDPATNQVVATIQLQSDYVRHIAAAGDAVILSELVWPDDQGPCGILTSIDPESNRVVARTPADQGCNAVIRPLAWDGEIWASGLGLSRVDPETARLVGKPLAYDQGRFPRSFLLLGKTEFWFAAYPGGNGTGPDILARMNPATGQVEYFDGVDPSGIAATLGPDTIWTLSFDGSVTRIDLR
jgi:hypothetical protein